MRRLFLLCLFTSALTHGACAGDTQPDVLSDPPLSGKQDTAATDTGSTDSGTSADTGSDDSGPPPIPAPPTARSLPTATATAGPLPAKTVERTPRRQIPELVTPSATTDHQRKAPTSDQRAARSAPRPSTAETR